MQESIDDHVLLQIRLYDFVDSLTIILQNIHWTVKHCSIECIGLNCSYYPCFVESLCRITGVRHEHKFVCCSIII